ncbi:MAG: EFR1 family ferrodoxin [Eubacteriales bacterium]|nr:EFR1 family ferrodoxin [Eubacteriales bacterium]
MVLYFSGTGNSQFAAVELARLLADGRAVSINRYLKTGGKAAIRSERPLVFVAPTYCWRLPKVVERWIMETEFAGSRDAYFILTCGGNSGNAAAYAEKLCAKKGLRFCGLASVVMPENYLALFPTPDEPACRAVMERAAPRIAALAGQIREGRRFAKQPVSLADRLESGPVNPLFYALFVHDKGFAVSESCVSCGKCAMRCPLNNIGMADGRPEWKGNCTHCMACIGGCPAGAISYKSKSKGRNQYYIMNDSLCWEEEV